IDPIRLKAYNLTIADVQSRIRAANIDINAGTVVDGDRVFLVRGMSRFFDAPDIANVVLRFVTNDNNANVAVRVSDIAQVVVADADIHNLVRIDGIEGVGLSIYKEAGANTVAVSQAVRDAMVSLTENMPGVNVSIVNDEGTLVEGAISDVEKDA